MKKASNDHRSRVTRMLIRRAFTQLLGSMPPERISVKLLCEQAGINRGTFYAHYDDVYDLLGQLEEEMLEDLRRALAPLMPMGEAPDDLAAVTAAVFQCLKDNSDLCTVTLGDYGDKAFLNRLLSLGRSACMSVYSRCFSQATPQQLEYYYAFASSGCIGLLRKWMEEGMSTPAGEMARMAERLMRTGMGFLQDDAPK